MRGTIVALLIVTGALAWRSVPAGYRGRCGTARDPGADGRAACRSLHGDADFDPAGCEASGGPRGVGYDLGKELAKRLGVPYAPVVFSRNADVLAAIKDGTADVAFTNSSSAARAKDMDFGPPFMDVELGYLVPKRCRRFRIG